MTAFWRRQLATSTTSAQGWFDLMAIMVLPLACFSLDRGLFRDGDWGPGMFSAFRPTVYASALVAMGSYLVSLIWRNAPEFGRAVATAGQLSGGIVVLIVTLGITRSIGTLVLDLTIGVLASLLPLVTSISLLRRGVRDLIVCPRRRRSCGLALGCLVGLLVPAVLAWSNWRSSAEQQAISVLKRARTDERIPLRALVAGTWNRVYVFGAYMSQERINETLGFRWDSVVAKAQGMNESSILLVLVEGSRVGQYLRIPTATGFVCVDESAIWQVRGGEC